MAPSPHLSFPLPSSSFPELVQLNISLLPSQASPNKDVFLACIPARGVFTANVCTMMLVVEKEMEE